MPTSANGTILSSWITRDLPHLFNSLDILFKRHITLSSENLLRTADSSFLVPGLFMYTLSSLSIVTPGTHETLVLSGVFMGSCQIVVSVLASLFLYHSQGKAKHC